MAIDHTERFAAIREAVKAEIGRDLRGFALVAVDDQGELYYGASYLECANHALAMAYHLAAIAKAARSFSKRKGGQG